MLRRSLLILFAGHTLYLEQGCASLDKRLNPIQPKVFVDAIEIKEATLSGLTALLTLNIENSNQLIDNLL